MSNIIKTNGNLPEVSGLQADNIAAIEKFRKLLNKAPHKSTIESTPDGNAKTLVISAVETKLDEVFLGQWGDDIEGVMQLGNEMLMWISLWAIDPITKLKITRSGCAAGQIMVDSAPPEVKSDKKAKNAWALDMQNKKPNAMYLGFPKLLSMCRKNAAQTFGKAFGRDLNRKIQDTPQEFYGNLFSDQEFLTDAKRDILAANYKHEFDEIWKKYDVLHDNEDFKKEYMYYFRIKEKTWQK